MGCRFVFALAAVFCGGAIQASAQHSSVPREGKAGEQTATHGIIRTPQARAIDSAKAGEAASSARPATPAQCPRKLSRLPSPRLCVPLRKPGSPCPLPRRLEPFSRGRHERHSADTPFAGRPSGSRCSGKHRTNGSRCPGTPPARPQSARRSGTGTLIALGISPSHTNISRRPARRGRGRHRRP